MPKYTSVTFYSRHPAQIIPKKFIYTLVNVVWTEIPNDNNRLLPGKRERIELLSETKITSQMTAGMGNASRELKSNR